MDAYTNACMHAQIHACELCRRRSFQLLLLLSLLLLLLLVLFVCAVVVISLNVYVRPRKVLDLMLSNVHVMLEETLPSLLLLSSLLCMSFMYVREYISK